VPWSENWRHQDRPDADQIPTAYRTFDRRSNRLILGYFGGVIVLSYVLLSTIGTQPTLVAGIPVLMWVMVGVALLILIGLYFTTRQDRSSSASSRKTSTVADERSQR
jgi:uncharacterized membrane protein YedE/YeeE